MKTSEGTFDNLDENLPQDPAERFGFHLVWAVEVVLELAHFIDLNRLVGIGIGFVDVHLLASALLADVTLWTADKRLHKAALDLGVDYRYEPDK